MFRVALFGIHWKVRRDPRLAWEWRECPQNNRARSVRSSVSFYVWKETQRNYSTSTFILSLDLLFPFFLTKLLYPSAPHSVSFWTCAARQNDRRVTSAGRPPRQALHSCVHQHYCGPGVCCRNMASPFPPGVPLLWLFIYSACASVKVCSPLCHAHSSST